LCWSASSNITFRGETDWEVWDDEDESPEVYFYSLDGPGLTNMARGLGEVLEASGFDWWVETR
jgi:hypothetical protein